MWSKHPSGEPTSGYADSRIGSRSSASASAFSGVSEVLRDGAPAGACDTGHEPSGVSGSSVFCALRVRTVSLPDSAREAQVLVQKLPVADASSLEGFEDFKRKRRNAGVNDRK